MARQKYLDSKAKGNDPGPKLPPIKDATIKTLESTIIQNINTQATFGQSFYPKVYLFPKTDIIKSNQQKRYLKNNNKKRYLVTMHHEAVTKCQYEARELKRRQLETVVAGYDWNIVKKVAKEKPFVKYIEFLVKRGQKLKSLLHDHSSTQAVSLRLSSLKEHRIYKDTKGHSEIELLESMKILLDSSPFRKGHIQQSKQHGGIDDDQYLGNDAGLKIPKPIELSRTFADLAELSSIVKLGIKTLKRDSEIFIISHSLMETIDLVEESIIKNGVILEERNSKKTFKSSSKWGESFEESRDLMRMKIFKLLNLRNQQKFGCCLDLNSVLEVYQRFFNSDTDMSSKRKCFWSSRSKNPTISTEND